MEGFSCIYVLASLCYNHLVTVAERQIGDGTIQTVNARQHSATLHAFLGVGKDFSTWVNDRIQKYGFVENQDFVFDSPISGNQSGRGGDRRSKDYHLSLDMAKELSQCVPLRLDDDEKGVSLIDTLGGNQEMTKLLHRMCVSGQRKS